MYKQFDAHFVGYLQKEPIIGSYDSITFAAN